MRAYGIDVHRRGSTIDYELEREEWRSVRQALSDAGVDPTDLARFVNRPHPGIPGFEPSRFDAARARPVLLAWLPRVRSRAVRDTLASRIRQAGKSSESAPGSDRCVPGAAFVGAR